MSTSPEDEKILLEAQQKLYLQLKGITNPNPTAIFHMFLLERQFSKDPIEEEKIVDKVCKHLFEHSELHTKDIIQNTLEMMEEYYQIKGEQTENINIKRWLKRLKNIRKGLGR
jgi:hypothetical protein